MSLPLNRNLLYQLLESIYQLGQDIWATGCKHMTTSLSIYSAVTSENCSPQLYASNCKAELTVLPQQRWWGSAAEQVEGDWSCTFLNDPRSEEKNTSLTGGVWRVVQVVVSAALVRSFLEISHFVHVLHIEQRWVKWVQCLWCTHHTVCNVSYSMPYPGSHH